MSAKAHEEDCKIANMDFNNARIKTQTKTALGNLLTRKEMRSTRLLDLEIYTVCFGEKQ